MHVDVSSLLDDGLRVFAYVFIGFSVPLAHKLTQRLHLQLTVEQQKAIDDFLYRATQVGVMAAEQLAKEKGWDHPEVRNLALGAALKFAIDHGDDNVLGMKAPLTKIKSTITAMLPAAAKDIIASKLTTDGPVVQAVK
jgi:hypothetical protein